MSAAPAFPPAAERPGPTRPSGFFAGTEMPTAGWWPALWPRPAEVLAAVGLAAGMDVVDLCAGDGWFTRAIAAVAARITAIDIDAEMLAALRRSLDEAHAANCDLVAGDAYAIATLVRRPIDLVFLANAFHGVPDRPRLAREVRKILKPGGLLTIVNWHPRPREETIVLGEPRGPQTALRLSVAQTIADVEAGGLRLVRTVELPPYHYGAIFERGA